MQVERIDTIESAWEPWERLALRTRNVFHTPEFARVWWAHFGNGQLAAVACCDRDGQVVAILPLYVWRRRPIKIVRFIGHRAGDELGPICEANRRSEVATALAGVLSDAGADLFIGEQLIVSHRWSELLGGRILRRDPSPCLDLRGLGWEAYLAKLSPNLRQLIRNRGRKLAREHKVRFRICQDPAALGDDLSALFGLHRARWRTGSAFSARESFHRDWAAVALARGWLRLWILDVDDSPAAAWYGFRFAGVDSYYQGGRSPAFDRFSIGTLIVAQTIQSAIEDGISEYRFLGGGDPYKARFTDDRTQVETIAVTPTASGSLAIRGLLAARTALRAYRRTRVRASIVQS